SPWPRIEITESLSTPAGISTVMVTVFFTRPEPLQTSQGSSTTFPVPLQSGHGPTLANWPKGVLWTFFTSPVPWQEGQDLGDVPFLAPVALHSVHSTTLLIFSCFFVPKAASSKVMEMVFWRSLPFNGPVRL